MDNRMLKYGIVIVIVLVVLGLIGWRMKNKMEDYAASMPQEMVTETMTVEEMPMMPEQVEPDMSAGTTEE